MLRTPPPQTFPAETLSLDERSFLVTDVVIKNWLRPLPLIGQKNLSEISIDVT